MIIMWLKELFDTEKQNESRRRRLEEMAENIYDVTLHGEQMWLCYKGELIAPMSILTEKTDVHECMALIVVMRKLYVERNLR